jgi:hypothetical protein
MQGMDKKYVDHVWLKVITTTIKNSFGLNFRNVRYLGHLFRVQADYDCFICLGDYNYII